MRRVARGAQVRPSPLAPLLVRLDGFKNSSKGRAQRKAALLAHVLHHWRPPRLRGGGAELAAALHAAVAPPLCAQLANLGELCAALQGEPGGAGEGGAAGEGGGGSETEAGGEAEGGEGEGGGGAGFGLAAEAGCRCPRAAPSPLLVGTHHKTGTVRLQQRPSQPSPQP